MLALTTLVGLAASALSLSTAPIPTLGLCTAAPPSLGTTLRGPVLHVLDGVTLCLALGTTPDTWIPLQIAEARGGSTSQTAAPARGTLMAVAFARDITCEVVGVSHGRSVADCRVDDRLISEQIHEPDAIQAGLAWR